MSDTEFLCDVIRQVFGVACAPMGERFALASKGPREYVFDVPTAMRHRDAFFAACQGMNAALGLGLQTHHTPRLPWEEATKASEDTA